MKKTIEIEYVGIEDLQEIMDDSYALMREGNYVSVELDNMFSETRVQVYVKLGGWEIEKDYDYKFVFRMTEKDTDVEEMNRCKAALKNLLVEE